MPSLRAVVAATEHIAHPARWFVSSVQFVLSRATSNADITTLRKCRVKDSNLRARATSGLQPGAFPLGQPCDDDQQRRHREPTMRNPVAVEWSPEAPALRRAYLASAP